MQVRVRYDMNQSVAMINRLEVLRKATQDPAYGKRLLDVELQLLSRSSMQSDDKYYPEQYKVYMNLIWFNGEIGTGAGDVAGGADHRPTDVSYTILDGIEKQLAAAKAAFDQVTASRDPSAANQNQ